MMSNHKAFLYVNFYPVMNNEIMVSEAREAEAKRC